jgi:uncharacterized protein (DUF2249 family)
MELRHCALEHSGVFPALGDRPLMPIKADEIGHRPILEAAEHLLPGEAIRINVDHNPGPLLDTIWTRDPDAFTWEPLALGPDRWVGVLRRRRPEDERGSVRPLPSLLRRRAGQIGARARFDRAVRELAVDLVAPAAPGELSPEASAWLSSATAAAAEMVRDGALSVLVDSLDTLLAAAPPEVVVELHAAQERRELGVV